jgi:hypothetical protein
MRGMLLYNCVSYMRSRIAEIMFTIIGDGGYTCIFLWVLPVSYYVSSNILMGVCRFIASIGISRLLVGGVRGFSGDLISGVGFLCSTGLCVYISWLVVASIQVIYMGVRCAAYLEVFVINRMVLVSPQSCWRGLLLRGVEAAGSLLKCI